MSVPRSQWPNRPSEIKSRAPSFPREPGTRKLKLPHARPIVSSRWGGAEETDRHLVLYAILCRHVDAHVVNRLQRVWSLLLLATDGGASAFGRPVDGLPAHLPPPRRRGTGRIGPAGHPASFHPSSQCSRGNAGRRVGRLATVEAGLGGLESLKAREVCVCAPIDAADRRAGVFWQAVRQPMGDAENALMASRGDRLAAGPAERETEAPLAPVSLCSGGGSRRHYHCKRTHLAVCRGQASAVVVP